jgi:tRNA threonylcarbamoyladenosine biosynthesis protein TsaE
MTMNFTLNEIDDVARKVLELVDSKTILVYGEMGVGKTTLIAALVKALGGTEKTSSPTFSLINEYQVKDDTVYHFDLYRLKDAYEALDIGIEDYFSSGHWVLIEWPEKIDVLLPSLSVKLYIKTLKNGSRALDLELVNSKLEKS